MNKIQEKSWVWNLDVKGVSLLLLACGRSGANADLGGCAGTALCRLILQSASASWDYYVGTGDTGPAGKIAVLNPDAALMVSPNLSLL